MVESENKNTPQGNDSTFFSFLRKNNNTLESNISWEKEGRQIITKSKILLHPKEKKIIKNLLQYPMPPDMRKEYWLIVSGAKREIQNNPEYYDSLTLNFPDYIPCPYEKQIEIDLTRTFPDDPFFSSSDIIDKLRRILTAYSRRSISIGYCQGFNYLVGKLLQLTNNEEETFWIFTQLIEYILPMGYFCELSGIMAYCSLINNFIKTYHLDICYRLASVDGELYLNNLIYKWLLSLFIQNTSKEIWLLLWDSLFLEGPIVIFKGVIALINLMSQNILQITSIEQAQTFFEKETEKFTVNRKFLNSLLIKRYDFNYEYIHSNTKKILPSIISGIKANGKFIYQHGFNSEKVECDLDWPCCAKDTEYNHQIPNYIIYQRIKKINIINDYYSKKNEKNPKEKNNMKKEKEEIYYNLVIERRNHTCGSQLSSISSRFKEEVNNDNEKLEEFNLKRKMTYKKFMKNRNDEVENYSGEEVQKIVQKVVKENKDIIKLPEEKEEESKDDEKEFGIFDNDKNNEEEKLIK